MVGIKNLLIIVAIILIFLILPRVSQPSIELQDDAIKMTFSGNGTVSSEAISEVAKKQMPEIKVVSSLISANCSKGIYQYTETVYSPEYYIFAPTLSGNDCLCPSEMYRKTDWQFYMFGSLYEPTKAYSVNTGWVEYDKCLATNCYTSGMAKMKDVTYLHPNMDWEKSYEAEIVVYVGGERNELHFDDKITEQKIGDMTVQFRPELECNSGDLIIYGDAVKHYSKYQAFASDMELSKTDFRTRIEKRNEIIGEIDALLEDQVPECRLSGQEVVCSPEKESTYTTIFLNLD